ncbi:MAG TPA: DUF4382 domain-containing protein [Terriglobia bacterium]|nr:DUF4382 domain-containing protein [Terriglobia bacterium]
MKERTSMENCGLRYYASLVLVVGALLGLGLLVSCGGGSSTGGGSSMSGTVTTNLSDPPMCSVNEGGTFAHVWVTITKVTAHINADAQATDSGWVTLVDLTSAPKQIDLLSLASTTCVLTQLGSTTGLPPGNYQQIRLFLLDNGSSGPAPSPNNCPTGFNCVMMANGPAVELNLSSEAQTGLKIPPGQIAAGGINIMAGQSADLNIDFNTCASIVMRSNGGARLKPTLHAGEVSVNGNSISGTVVDSMLKKPIVGAIVFAEQPSNGVDRVMMSTVTDAGGNFIFCPLPAGNYDFVVAALTGGVAYNATVTFQVPLGTALTGNNAIQLVAETGTTGPGTITGQITTTTGTAATAADVTLLALQSATPSGGSAIPVTIPVFAGSTALPLPTAAGTCPANTDCATYTLLVPASNPSVGTFASGGTTYSTPTAPPILYTIEADATTTASTPTADCNPSTVPISTDNANNPLAVTAGGSVTAATIAFTACQ